MNFGNEDACVAAPTSRLGRRGGGAECSRSDKIDYTSARLRSLFYYH